MKHYGLTLAVLTTFAVSANSQGSIARGQNGSRRTAPNGQNDGRTVPTPKLASAGEQIMESMRRMRENDPAKTVTPMLVKRADVRGEIGLDPKQREALEAAKKKDSENSANKLNNNEFFLAIQQRLADIAKLPPAEQDKARTEAVEGLKEQGQKLAESMRGDQEKTANVYDKVLRPEQLERLRQLDWQWRGPLALSDPKMNDIFQLSMEQQEVIGRLVQEFREQQREIMGKALGEDAKTPATPNENVSSDETIVIGDGSGEKTENSGTIPLKDGGKGRVLAPKNETEIRNRHDAAKREVDILRKKYGDMTLKLLSPEQRQYWFQSLGRQFTFRAND